MFTSLLSSSVENVFLHSKSINYIIIEISESYNVTKRKLPCDNRKIMS